MQDFWIPALLVGNTLLAFLLGWLANRAWIRSSQRQQENGLSVPETRTLSPYGQRCRTLLTDIWVDLGVYSQALQEFSAALEHDLDGAPVGGTGGPISIVREAGGRFAMVIDENHQHLQEFAKRYGGVLQSMVHRITEFRDRAEEIDTQLSKLDATPTDELKTFVGETTLKLIEDNLRLQSDLSAARRCIAEQENNLSTVQRDVRVDPLTELPNRQAFEEKLTELHAFWTRCEQPYVLALLDIDGFGRFNDTHGIAAGDAMLQTVARVMLHSKRAIDQLARVDADTFGVFIPRCTLAMAERVAERYRQSIAAGSLIFRGDRLSVTVGTGLAEVRQGEPAEQLMQRALAALQSARETGPHELWIHDGSTSLPSTQSKQVEETLNV